jgi:hypothetical protein
MSIWRSGLLPLLTNLWAAPGGNGDLARRDIKRCTVEGEGGAPFLHDERFQVGVAVP